MLLLNTPIFQAVRKLTPSQLITINVVVSGALYTASKVVPNLQVSDWLFAYQVFSQSLQIGFIARKREAYTNTTTPPSGGG